MKILCSISCIEIPDGDPPPFLPVSVEMMPLGSQIHDASLRPHCLAWYTGWGKSVTLHWAEDSTPRSTLKIAPKIKLSFSCKSDLLL